MAWMLQGEGIPFDTGRTQWWVDSSGRLSLSPVPGAERLPGRFVLLGLVDAHAHAALGLTEDGPVALTEAQALDNLDAWRSAGVAFVRDVGAPHSLTLSLTLAAGYPRLQAAGRFLAPAGQYFPELHDPVAEADLVEAALGEIARGARWVKLVSDFPPQIEKDLPAEATYDVAAIAVLCSAVHAAGARVAAHSTIDNVADLVRSGVDSIEHGVGVDDEALALMAERGVAWTPTLSAIIGGDDGPELSEEARGKRAAFSDRLRHLLPAARRLGVPVLAGTDVAGTIAGEVAMLARHGLDPAEAIAAATTTAYGFLGEDPARAGSPANLVSYESDPRNDPSVLAAPAAVIVNGVRIR